MPPGGGPPPPHPQKHSAGAGAGAPAPPPAPPAVPRPGARNAPIPTGTPIHELLAERVLEPLGMGHTVAAITNGVRLDEATGYRTLYDDRPPHREHPLVEARWIVGNTADGSIVSDVVDMCSYARLLLKRGDGVLSHESFDHLT